MLDLTCRECQKIATELINGCSDAWISSDRRSKEVFVAARNLMGGTEEARARFEGLLPGARVKGSQRINLAIRMKLAHETFSGHKMALGRF